MGDFGFLGIEVDEAIAKRSTSTALPPLADMIGAGPHLADHGAGDVH
jgi:hypothetical protein